MSFLGRLACKIGWHAPGERFAYRVWYGGTHQTLCARCRTPVDWDSQGNWYATEGTPQFQAAFADAARSASPPSSEEDGPGSTNPHHFAGGVQP